MWIPTPEIDVLGPMEGQRDSIVRALGVVTDLVSWYLLVRERLRGGEREWLNA